jgi:hypothetical protein
MKRQGKRVKPGAERGHVGRRKDRVESREGQDPGVARDLRSTANQRRAFEVYNFNFTKLTLASV